MKLITRYPMAALIALAILFSGCPYSSTIPLSEATAKIPDSFIGTWERMDSEGDKVEVKRTGPNTMDVIQPNSEGEPTIYHAHFTEIGGSTFMNLKEDGEYSNYLLYKLEKEGDFKIKLVEVTPYIRETFETSADLRKFVEQNMQHSFFFTNEESTYYKIK